MSVWNKDRLGVCLDVLLVWLFLSFFRCSFLLFLSVGFLCV